MPEASLAENSIRAIAGWASHNSWCGLARLGIIAGVLTLTLSSCYVTSVGRWDADAYARQDYGSWRDVRVCVYLDEGVSKEQALGLMSDWTTDGTARFYHINVIPEGFESLPREGFLHNAIMDQVAHIPLQGNCDRVFYFVNHRAGDYAYATLPILLGIFPPEVLGEVDDPTMTHGYAFVSADNPFNAMVGAKQTVWHEFYHLIGSCPHSTTLGECYARIAGLKRIASDSSFYPSMSLDGKELFTNRSRVNTTLAQWQDPFLP
jgi:hypothetical protein